MLNEDLVVESLNIMMHWFVQVDNPHWLIIALILLHTLTDHVQTLAVHGHLIAC